MTQLGFYTSNDPAALTAAQKWLGRPVDNVLNYLNNDSWAAFDSSVPHETGLWRSAAASTIWSVPLTVWGTSLEQVATGAYNSHFLQAAQALAQCKPSSDGSIYVRVGWEFNGTWMPWSAPGHEAAFIQAFHNLVDTFRSVSGQFKFVWDVNEGGGSIDPAKAYPGDKYVDVVGMDSYYNIAWDSKDPAAAFQNNVTEQYGLQWQQDFAAAHGKPTAISEWGIQTDNAGPYIQAMAKWLADHKVVFANYWDSNFAAYNGQIDNGQYPNASAAFKAAFAGVTSDSHAQPPASTPTAPPAQTPDTLVLRVSGDSWQGSPHFTVSVDGKQVGGTLTTSAAHAANQTQDITLTGSFGPGAHNVAITFLDDAYGGWPAADRNLYVHQISLDGTVYAGSTAENAAGYNSNGVANLYSSGSATIHTLAVSAPPASAPTAPPAQPSDTLVLRVSGDSWQGSPHFTVSVDGKQVGGTLTTSASHAAGQTQDITLTGSFGTGAHKVAIAFLDDAYGGSPAADRNLYVHQVSLDGTVYAGSAAVNTGGYNSNGVANLYSNGSADWQFL
ncbi:carbohydrate-binding domain-containing protein [Methylobacterium nigriterrae]|uniref:carbohydrate-binding domain-containing protein n=1 Tax=Methylobacterium nigriterrae TaxID=3127512 RepID=UPI003013DEA5